MKDKITLDGSIGEGGGHVLRTALSLAAITGHELELVKIRAGREKPGLKRQHLTCVKAVAEICGAKVSDVAVGSSSLAFEPGAIKGGNYRFDIGTAGSVTLVAQTVIPVLLKAEKPSTVTITGGTHVPFSPVWEFFVETYLPELRRIGARVEAEIDQCGFYPAAGGVVKLRIWPYDDAKKPDGYELVDLGAYNGGVVKGVVSHLPRSIAEAEVGIVGVQLRDLKLKHDISEVDAMGPGNYCCVKLDYERATVVFSGVGTYNKSRKAVANEIVRQVREFVNSGKACEKHLADQLLLPIDEADGHNYFTDMLFALGYARENRRRMMEAMKETVAELVPEAGFVRTIDIHHNYASCEEHFGRSVFVHRKGATSAKLGEIGVIPGSMGTASYIVRGLGNPDSFTSCSHGAGRRMSRVAASTTLTVEECDRAMDGIVCERWHKYRGFGKAKGRLDLSEAPQAYKDIEDVIASERDLVEPLVRLVPLASLKG